MMDFDVKCIDQEVSWERCARSVRRRWDVRESCSRLSTALASALRQGHPEAAGRTRAAITQGEATKK
jgi:hypothetical protein